MATASRPAESSSPGRNSPASKPFYTRRRILETISGGLESLVRQGAIVREDEFWLPANVVRQERRNRRDAALSLRRPDRIAAQEYRLAVNPVLRGSVAASKSELTASVGNGGNRRYRRKTRDYAIGKRRIEDLCLGISRKLVDLTVSFHCNTVKKQ